MCHVKRAARARNFVTNPALRVRVRVLRAAVGYRVLSVQKNSPASNVTIIHNGIRQLTAEERIKGQSLVAFFDFIISINGHRLVRCAMSGDGCCCLGAP